MAGRRNRAGTGLVSACVGAAALVLGLFTAMAVARAVPDTAEAQIKTLIADQLTALRAVDAVAYGATYCVGYRHKVESDQSQMFTPPDVAQLVGANAKRLRAKAIEYFPLAPSDGIEVFVRAVADEDQGAVDAAWHQLWASSFAKLEYRVKSVEVTGDTAKAVVMVRVGAKSSDQPWELVREDQEWKDCTAPPEQRNIEVISGGQGGQGLPGDTVTGQ